MNGSQGAGCAEGRSGEVAGWGSGGVGRRRGPGDRKGEGRGARGVACDHRDGSPRGVDRGELCRLQLADRAVIGVVGGDARVVVPRFDAAGGAVVDRRHGVIRFAPSANIVDSRGELHFAPAPLGAVPAQGREIRVSYRTGGGMAGNVAAGTLTTLRDAVPGIAVSNPVAAAGGRDAESFENTLVRGPTDFHRLERAVTSRDVEVLAK